MSSVGTWRAPLPFKVGGGGHRTISDLLDRLLANMGDSVTSDSDSYSLIETKATARALSYGQRAIDRFLAQIDPLKLTTLLTRWEAILGIVPGSSDTNWDRCRRVQTRISKHYSSRGSGLARIAIDAFAPWTTKVHYVPKEDAFAFYPAASNTTTDRFWSSTTARFIVEYIRPKGASDADVLVRKTTCHDSLDEFCAVWATFDFTETQEGTSPEGFYLDTANTLDNSYFGI